MDKLKIYSIYIYIAPILLSFYVIYVNGALLGDFRNVVYEINITDIISFATFYFVPLFFLVLIFKAINNIKVKEYNDGALSELIFNAFIFILLVTLVFGVNKIGQDAQIGVNGFFIKVASKLNPIVMLPMLAFSKIKFKKMILCAAIVVFYSYRQESLQGGLIAILCVAAYLLNNFKIKSAIFIFSLAFPIIFSGVALSFVSYVYSIRNEMRGTGFNIDEILSLAVGRVSTTSSFYYIVSNFFDYNAISDFFTPGIISERFLGVNLFNTVAPSDVFNQQVIGNNQSYSIFMGLPGFIYFLLKGDLHVALLNLTFLAAVLMFIYFMIPVVDKKNRICVFFFVMYFPILSFDIWEISILLQTVILWRITIFIFLIKKTRSVT